MSLKERLNYNSYVDDDGDVLPFADIASDLDTVPVSNASIVQGMTNLEAHAANAAREERLQAIAEADAAMGREQAVLQAGQENAGVQVSLEQHYRDELALMDLISGAHKRGGKTRGKPGGFAVAHRTHPEIAETYGDRLPQVAAGARRNHIRMETADPLTVYHAQELIDAGIGDKEEVIFDARTIMKNEYRAKYYGDDEKDKLRASRRRYLKKKLAEYASK